MIVSKSVRCFIELLILRSQAEKHPIYVQHGAAGLHLARLHRSLSDGQEHLVLRRELVLQVPILLQGFQHSDPMTGATGSVCPRPPSTSSSRGVFSHPHTHTHTHRCFFSFPHRPLVPPDSSMCSFITVLNTDYATAFDSVSPLHSRRHPTSGDIAFVSSDDFSLLDYRQCFRALDLLLKAVLFSAMTLSL